MKVNFGLKDRELDEIKILYYLFPEIDEIIIFGSRARGDYKLTSDIDIALKGKIDNLTLCKIRDYFEESRIPYLVDIIYYEKIMNIFFKESIDKDGIIIKI